MTARKKAKSPTDYMVKVMRENITRASRQTARYRVIRRVVTDETFFVDASSPEEARRLCGAPDRRDMVSNDVVSTEVYE